MKGKDSLSICESKYKFGRSTNATSSICNGYSSQLACKEKCQRENCEMYSYNKEKEICIVSYNNTEESRNQLFFCESKETLMFNTTACFQGKY